MIRQTFAAVVLLAAGACATSPEVSYFRLEPLAGGRADAPLPGPGAAGQSILGVGPMLFPEYLRRAQMVRRDSAARMVVDDFNRWVDALDQEALRALAANLDLLLPDQVAVPVPVALAFDMDYQLDGNVVRFEANPADEVELVVQWRIRDLTPAAQAPGGAPQDEARPWVVAPRTSHYRAQASGPGPAAVAAAMADALAQFSRDAADAMRRGVIPDAGSDQQQ